MPGLRREWCVPRADAIDEEDEDGGVERDDRPRIAVGTEDVEERCGEERPDHCAEPVQGDELGRGGAYTNDWVSPEHTSAAASQLVTLYGLGAMVGPLFAAPFLDILGSDGYAWSIIVLHAAVLVFLVYRIRAWHAPLTTKAWHDVSFHGRAFFVPATIVSMGVSGRKGSRVQEDPS